MAVGIKDKNSESGWIKLFDFERIHLMRGQDVQLLQVLEENNRQCRVPFTVQRVWNEAVTRIMS